MHIYQRSLRFAAAAFALTFCGLSADRVEAQNSALRLGPTNTDTYVTFVGSCVGGSNPGTACAASSQCTGGGTCSAAGLGLSTFTIETWFKREGTGSPTSSGTGGIASLVPLVTRGAAQADGSELDANYLLGINTAGNVIAADFEEGATGASPGLNHPISGVTPIQNDTWYHAAATYDGTEWRLYLNGELEASLTVGQPPRADSTQRAALGTTLRSTGLAAGFFDGTVDEARIWNVARTAAQIRSAMNAQNPSDASLVARWGLNEGAGTAVGDSAGAAENGEILGTNFSWVSGAPFDILPCANAPSSMLRFDGTNDYVTFGLASELGLTTFTLETWFKREATGDGNSTGSGGIADLVPLIAKGAPEADGSSVDANYILGINTSGNVLAADFEDTATGLNHPVSGTTAIVNNNWYHAAATYDGTTWRLFLNGALEATLVVGAFTPRSDSIQPAGLGTMQKSALSPGELGFFAGVLDEVRIWNFARSEAQIQADMYSQLTSGGGLVARWGLGEGSGTTAGDSIGAPFSDGALTNGPAWTASNSLFDANGACDDGSFCNGEDTCSGTGANGLRCTTNAGDPCLGGSECNADCNEAADNCFDLVGTACTSDGDICTDDECDGAGTCAHPNNSEPCDDGLFCTDVDQCSGGSCMGSGDPCAGGPECEASCNEAADNCFDPAGVGCTDDGNACTDDECNGTGSCAHPNNTEPCDDGLFCTDVDQCSGGSCMGSGDPCAGGPECAASCNETTDNCFDPAGVGCTDDTNACTDDECDGAGACVHPNNSEPCDDGLACTTVDVCSGGVCTGDMPPECDDDDPCTQDGCDDVIGCLNLEEPATECFTAERAQLFVGDAVDDDKNRLKWKWQRGVGVSHDDFGDPSSTTSYTLCIYDSSAGATSLATSLLVEPNGAWQDKSPKGWKFGDKSVTFDGVKQIKLRPGADGRSAAQLKAQGMGLPMPAPAGATFFTQDPKVTVQLLNSEGRCWSSEFTDNKVNSPETFKAKAQQ